jgi:tRNA-uridine 2-sulfurtransferase
MHRPAGTRRADCLERTWKDLPASGRVLVAASGGVDSSMSLWLLKQRGLQVFGATLRMISPEDPALVSDGFCSSESAVARAERVCRILDLPHRILEAADLFREQVLTPFFTEYDTGLTPNPCVWCNASVKWNALLQAARELDCAYVATGHYARLDRPGRRIRLLRARDRGKDQSYALYRLGQEALARTLFPLGGLEKKEVRLLARELELPSWDLPESQDICFLPRGSLGDCLSRRTSSIPGSVVDRHGNLLGTHRGLPHYTVGQRKGLGIPSGAPIYVIRKDQGANRLVVGPREDLCRRSFSVNGLHWVSIDPPTPGERLPVQVEVRFRSRPIPGELIVCEDRTATLHIETHDQSIAPGQSAVWYREEVLLGGGIIRTEEEPPPSPESRDF